MRVIDRKESFYSKKSKMTNRNENCTKIDRKVDCASIEYIPSDRAYQQTNEEIAMQGFAFRDGYYRD